MDPDDKLIKDSVWHYDNQLARINSREINIDLEGQLNDIAIEIENLDRPIQSKDYYRFAYAAPLVNSLRLDNRVRANLGLSSVDNSASITSEGPNLPRILSPLFNNWRFWLCDETENPYLENSLKINSRTIINALNGRLIIKTASTISGIFTHITETIDLSLGTGTLWFPNMWYLVRIAGNDSEKKNVTEIIRNIAKTTNTKELANYNLRHNTDFKWINGQLNCSWIGSNLYLSPGRLVKANLLSNRTRRILSL